MMAKAFVFMRKKMVAYASDETIEQMAKDYENTIREADEASSKAMKGNKYHLGKHWYNNGKINKRAKECPPGFVPGMLK